MQFANLSALYYLWLVPLLGALFLWAGRRKRRAVAAFGDRSLIAKLSQAVSPMRDRLKSGLILAGVFFLVLALARPQWGERTEEVVRTGVDVFIALDTSLSMDATDIAPSRLEKARHIAANLIDRLQGNRVGLIVFSGSAFVQCPLTLDDGAARIFLDSVSTGAVPEGGTNVASAIEAARGGFVSRESKYKVVVLLTDGEQTEGDFTEVADQARQEGIVIHTVGVGTAAGDPIPIRDARGEITDYKRDEAGQPVLSRLDEESLSRIALATGGEYYRASDEESEVEEIAELVASMEGKELSAQLFTRYEERYYWPLGFAVAFLIAESAIPRGRRRKKEAAA
ncbi:MAG: vWA domain-containing protein [Gammaproteobacteria bacterium]